MTIKVMLVIGIGGRA